MATVIETTRTTEIPLRKSASNGRRKFQTEASINRYLMKHKNYEYVNGKFQKKNMPNAKHSGITGRLTIEIGIFLRKHKIGRVYPEAHFQIGADKRIPDVAFVANEKLPDTGEPQAFWTFAPDLAVEITSPTDFYQDVLEKIHDYFKAEVKQVWLINPEQETLTIYFSPEKTEILSKTDTLVCEEILPKFRLKLSDIFVD